MVNNNAFIQFKWGTLENFNSLQNKDNNTLYFLDDGSLYLGYQYIGKDYEYGDYSTSWPLNPIVGKLYINVSTGEIRDYDGTDWTTIVDPSVFGEKSYYDNKSKKNEYLYEMDYSILDYEAAKIHFLEQRNSSLLTGAGACSSVVSNGFAGRNFDWFYNSDVTVVIHTPQVTHIEDNVQTITRHAVLGVTGGHAEITKETIESGENSELYKYIPFYLLDGINDAGLYCNINVVPLENGYTSYSNPTGSEEEELCVLMLSRYVLDKFSRASEAATYIQQHVKVYGAGYLDTVHYGIHMMISDGTSTKVLEFINGETVITDSSIMTNFMIDGVTFESDGSVLTNPAVSGDATPSSKGLSLHGSGLERWNILNANKSLVNSIDSMGELMESIKYSQTYTNGDNNDRPVWFSELCNDSSHGGNEVSVDMVITDTTMTNAISTVRGWYQNRERGDMKTWHTAHSSAYDFATKSLRLISQEEFDVPYYFYLADTFNELDIKINKIKQECEQTSAVLYTEQTLTDVQKQQARINIGVEPSVEIIPVDFYYSEISGKSAYPSPTAEQMELIYRALHPTDDRNVIVAVCTNYSKSDLWLANIFTYPNMAGIEYVSFSRGSRVVESDFFTGGSNITYRTVATNVRVFFPKNSIAAFNAKTYEEQVEQLGVDPASGYIVALGSDMSNLSKANMSMIYSDPHNFLDFDSDPWSEEILPVRIKRDGGNGISIYGYRFFEDNGIQKLMICSVELDSSIGKLVASEKVYTVEGITDAPSDNKQYVRKNGQWSEVESQPLMVETTYTALKTMRDGGNLVPGTFYRITDYECTTTDEETQSAGHVFDIIVQPLSESTLSEDARAIQHDGDTYFADSNLAAWKLKYCLDNDTVRFGWADEIDGKGVIYRMIDEFGNDVAYDFKNIMFKRYQITWCLVNDNLVGLYLGMPDSNWHENDTTMFKYMYTFCAIDSDWECHDLSIIGNNGTVRDPNVHDTGCKNNVFKPAFEKPGNSRNLEHQMLNNGVFVTEHDGTFWHYCGCSGNRNEVGCRNWTYSDRYIDNGNPKTEYSSSSPWTCGNNCSYWMVTGGMSYWTADDNAQYFYINSYSGSNCRLLSGSYGGKLIPEHLYNKTIGVDSNNNLRVWNIADGVVSITWSDLKYMRDFGSLSTGTYYRITDYECKTTQSNSQSASHVFDIIVYADDASHLSENAYAVHHEGDTYFANSKLEAWELKYCLDNDTNRFAWADTINGKGVIYYMKDEFDNECPYDFKNIQFKIGVKSNAGTKANVYYYTFSVATGTNDATVTDHSLNGSYCYGNLFKEYIKSNKRSLNFIVCRNTFATSKCYRNSAGVNCYDIACGNYGYMWSCGSDCHGWSCGSDCYHWTCGNSCNNWTCGNYCQSWHCGIFCSNWTCGNDCSRWTCGNDCSRWTCGNTCYSWSCGNHCQYWKFGSSTVSKSYYRYIIIDDGCSYFYLDTNQTTSSSNFVQNIHICQGIAGISSAYKTITIDTVNNDYSIRVENDSDGNMHIYNLPDELNGGGAMTFTTYSALKSLRDGGNLIPGAQYRITDYVTTTAASNTQSAGNVFDVIVRADDVNILNENAHAALHSGDTYFANSKLEAWQLKYCLDNDTNRFDWADTVNGKGIIYYMKDEFGNEVPYDFKNIQFMIDANSNAGTLANVYYYTFSVATGTNDETVTDYSLNSSYCYGNLFKEYVKSKKQSLNFIVCRNAYATSLCYGNSTGVCCYNIVCGDDCYRWSCGSNCSNWSCGSECYDWLCGDDCYRWSCGSNCSNWSCGDRCYEWSCGNDCDRWSCGNYCGNWLCGDYCSSWSCGNDCYGWSCGNSCNRWSCDNECYNWSCGNNCNWWSCGNGCINWLCGNNCNSWACGNECTNWKFGNSSNVKNYYRNIIIDNRCKYFYLDTNQTTSSSNYVQNIHICQGIAGTSSVYKTITVDTVNNDYQIEYKAANSVTNII